MKMPAASIFVAVFTLWSAGALMGQSAPPPNHKPMILNGVGIDQKLNVQVPPDLLFTDDTGHDVHLGDYFGKKPVILALVYYDCPMLCTMVLNDMSRAMNAMKMSCGDQFEIITVSFNPRETYHLAAQKKAQYLRTYQRPTAAQGWHFLTGTEPMIERLTSTVGFHYVWDQKFKQYAHASGLIILTPEGKTSRYFYGIDYAPSDLELALADASGGKSVPVADKVLLYCFHYDPTTGRYSLMVFRLVQVFGALTVLALIGYMTLNFVRDRRNRKPVPEHVPANGQWHEHGGGSRR